MPVPLNKSGVSGAGKPFQAAATGYLAGGIDVHFGYDTTPRLAIRQRAMGRAIPADEPLETNIELFEH